MLGSMDRGLGNWLMEGVGVWVVGQAALVQLGFCLCVRVGVEGHLVLLCLGGRRVGVFYSHNKR